MGSILPRKRNDGTTGYTAMLRIKRGGKTKTQELRTIQASALGELRCSQNIPHAACVSGHRAWKSLQRYTHIRLSGDKYKDWEWRIKLIGTAPTAVSGLPSGNCTH